MLDLLKEIFISIFCALVFAAAYKLFSNRERLREYWLSCQQDWLSDKAHRHRIQFDVAETTPMTDATQAIHEKVDALLASRDYLRLADFIMDLDQNRTKCPSHKSLALVAIFHFADRTHIPGNVGVETPDSFAAQIEHQSTIHPRRYILVVMAALLRIREAWAARGDGFADSISQKDWAIIEKRVGKAEWLLSHTDPVALDSPLVAMCQFELLAFASDADRKLMPIYETWSKLDPACQAPHEQVGFKLLPRWYGDLPTLEKEARRAAIRTQSACGMAAYYKMFT